MTMLLHPAILTNFTNYETIASLENNSTNTLLKRYLTHVYDNQVIKKGGSICRHNQSTNSEISSQPNGLYGKNR